MCQLNLGNIYIYILVLIEFRLMCCQEGNGEGSCWVRGKLRQAQVNKRWANFMPHSLPLLLSLLSPSFLPWSWVQGAPCMCPFAFCACHVGLAKFLWTACSVEQAAGGGWGGGGREGSYWQLVLVATSTTSCEGCRPLGGTDRSLNTLYNMQQLLRWQWGIHILYTIYHLG